MGFNLQVRYGKARGPIGAESNLLEFYRFGDIVVPENSIFLVLGCSILCTIKDFSNIRRNPTGGKVSTNSFSVLEFLPASAGNRAMLSALHCG